MQVENEAKRVGEQYRQRVESLGLTEADDDYWTVYDHVISGNPSRLKAADSKLKKLEQAKTKVEGEEMSKETEEQRIERLAEEKAQTKYRAKLEEKGLLESDAGGPSAASRSFAEIEKGYAAGETSYEVYTEARKKQGI